MIDRRALLAATGAVLLASPLAADAQQVQKIPKVGLLAPGTPTAYTPSVETFRQGLR